MQNLIRHQIVLFPSVFVRSHFYVLICCFRSLQSIITRDWSCLSYLVLLQLFVSLGFAAFEHRCKASFDLDLELRMHASWSQNPRVCLFVYRLRLGALQRRVCSLGPHRHQLFFRAVVLIGLFENLSSSLFPYLQPGVEFALGRNLIIPVWLLL